MNSSLRIVAVGDLQLGDSPTTVGYGFYSRYGRGQLDGLFADTRSALADADVVFGNLETMLEPPKAGETRRSELQLRGTPSFAADLRRIGFTVLNVANNHAAQHGDDAFHNTVAAVRSAGIACCGVRGTDGWASEPAVLHQGKGVLGILGYCLRPRQYGSAAPPYAEGTQEQICADVKRLRATGAIVVVSLHWGEEFVGQPSRSEMALGHAIIDAGAAAIVGHHPHVTRPVEQYKSGLIAYSLGNFIGDMVWFAPFRRGLVLRCLVSDSGASDGTLTFTRLRDDYRPVLVAGELPRVASEGELTGLDAPDYDRAIAESMRLQRLAAYKSAVINLPRTPLPVLAQLVTQTIRNKLAAAVARRV